MRTARRIIAGYEMFVMIRKNQVAQIPANDVEAERTFIASLFAVAA
jgi:transposase, IS6 family